MTETKAGPLADKTVYELLATAEAVIRDLNRWEFVYAPISIEGGPTTCTYRDHRGAPSCLIGHVLYRWGALGAVEEGGAPEVLPRLGSSLAVTDVAAEIQYAQDRGHTWGEALAAGRRAAEREVAA